MKLLFIARAWPPVIGGIEQQNHSIGQALAKYCDIDIIANRHGKKMLPLFLPFATLRALAGLRRYDAILLGDGVLGITGAILKLFTRKRVACIVHGLDLTYRSRIYQSLWVRRFLPRLDHFIAVGRTTRDQGIARGLPADRITFIPNGVEPVGEPAPCNREQLGRRLGRPVSDTLLLTLGRLVRRKGVAWFIGQVLPDLDDDVTYIVAGDGPEFERIATIVEQQGLQRRVIMTGRVSGELRELLFACADLFVQPNIRVPGDMEGFGLVVLEAAARACPVVAADLEGLRDAISDGDNGHLLAAEDAPAWHSRLQSLLADRAALQAAGQRARRDVETRFNWDEIAKRYIEVLDD